MNIKIDKANRQQEFILQKKNKKLKLEVSRKDCRDILVEFIDINGVAKSKPLNKCVEEMKLNNIEKIRFTMNEMSVKPIEIKLLY